MKAFAKWLQSHAHQNREPINTVHLKNDFACAANGFEAVFIKPNKRRENILRSLFGTKQSQDYPIETIINDVVGACSKSTMLAEIAIDANRLCSIIKAADDIVFLRIYNNKKAPLELNFYVDDQPAYAILMPIVNGDDETPNDDPNHRWKPML